MRRTEGEEWVLSVGKGRTRKEVISIIYVFNLQDTKGLNFKDHLEYTVV